MVTLLEILNSWTPLDCPDHLKWKIDASITFNTKSAFLNSEKVFGLALWPFKLLFGLVLWPLFGSCIAFRDLVFRFFFRFLDVMRALRGCQPS